MFLLNFSFRRILRHWRINLLIFTGLVLTGALVAGLPTYAQFIAVESLNRALEDEPAFSRNILLTAPPSVTTFNAALNQVLIDELGFLVQEQFEVRAAETNLYRSPDGNPDSAGISAPARLWSFTRLSGAVEIVEGRLPGHIPALTGATALIDPQPIEAAVGLAAARGANLNVGDVLYDDGEGIVVTIVGIVDPLEPDSERWFEDLRPFELEVQLGLNEDVVTTPFLLNPLSMSEFFPDGGRSWRLVVDQDLLNPQNVDRIQAGIENAQAGFSTYGVELTSGIPLLLDNYLIELSTARITLLLLTAQALIFIFYTLGMITSFMLDRSRTEIAALSSRGSRRGQILGVLSMEGFILAIPGAALLGPPLVGLFLRAWKAVAGVRIVTAVAADAWMLAAAAALVGWISFVIPGFAVTGRGMVSHQQARARPPRQSAWQRSNLDIFLFLLSAAAYWQLSESGSFVLERLGDNTLADPLLLLGPSLLLIAVAVLFLRIFPLILRWIYGYTQHTRGLILPLGLARLARDPIAASRVVLLISLAAGLTIFSISFRDSLEYRQAEIAHYLSGADLRVSTTWKSLEEIAAIPGVQTISPVYRMRIQAPAGRFVQLMAVDPDTFGQVARYPEGIGDGITIAAILELLERPLESGRSPAVISGPALPVDMTVGSEFDYQIIQQFLTFELRGVILQFPTLTGEFLLIRQNDVADWEHIRRINLAQGEAWLSVDPARHESVAAHFTHRGEILGDARAQFEKFRSNILAEGGKRAFAFNAGILAVLSVAGFMIVHYFTAPERSVEFGVLRAGGLSGLQLLVLLVVEGVIVMILGLASGTLVGLGLSLVMRPFLSRVFSMALSGAVVERIIVDWTAIGQIFGLLAAFYALALLGSVLLLLRQGVQRSLRVSVE